MTDTVEVATYGLYIGGGDVAAASGETFGSIRSIRPPAECGRDMRLQVPKTSTAPYAPRRRPSRATPGAGSPPLAYRAITFNSPFGGYKASGFGRVNGAEAIDSFLQTKSVWCELSDDVQDRFVMKI